MEQLPQLEPIINEEPNEDSEEEYEQVGQPMPIGNYPNAASNHLINQLFQDILNKQENSLITNFNILMSDFGDMDLQTRNDIFQDQFRDMVDLLTKEFIEIFTDRSDVKTDEFCKCAICYGDEEPYIRLNCACKIMLHRQCYIDYLEHDRKLSCPICKETIFQNHLKD